MSPVPYNRSIMGQPFVLRVFTNMSLGITCAFTIAALAGIGFIAGISVFSVLFLENAYLRFGKPPGFDEHLIRGLFAPKHFRPSVLAYIRPVAPSANPQKDTSTPPSFT